MTVTVELAAHSCWCGMEFAIPNSLYKHHYAETGHVLFCPLGHQMVVIGKSWKEQISDLKLTIQEKDNLLDGERTKRVWLEKRIQKGVCLYCKRTFQNLAEHMKHQHKDKLK